MKPIIAGAFVAGMLFVAPPASAVFQNGTFDPILDPPLALDNSWVIIDEVMSVGSFFTGAFTWTSPKPVVFEITDLFVVTDVFEVYDFGALVLSTPFLPEYTTLGLGAFDSPPWTADPNVALTDGRFSGGTVLFAAGSHSITIRDVYIPSGFGDGTVAFRAMAIPEPTSLLVLGVVLAGIGAQRRKRLASRPTA